MRFNYQFCRFYMLMYTRQFLDLSLHTVTNTAECEALMDKGWKNRSVGATEMNADSSRSHSIFTISIEMMSTSK